MKRAILAIGTLLAVEPAAAAFQTGNDLLQLCGSQVEAEQGFCIGLITGYFDGMRLTYSCPRVSPRVTVEQLRDIALKTLRDRPDVRHEPAVYPVASAFKAAFGCKLTK